MFFTLFVALVGYAESMPRDFVSLAAVEPTIEIDAKYFGTDNFVGAKIDGYEANKCILTRRAAESLAAAHRELTKNGFGLKVFDCYRPQKAVDHFVRWAKDLADEKHKSKFYPAVPKNELFSRGYIAEQSGHSRGSTVDLTMVKLGKKAGVELDMGTIFDFFDERTHTASPLVPADAAANRQKLKAALEKFGFKNYPKEWWHYTMVDEPHPKTFFNFPVR